MGPEGRGEHPLQARARRRRPTRRRCARERVAEFREKFANPYVAASRGFVDEVIRPRADARQADRRARQPRQPSATRIRRRSTGTFRCEPTLAVMKVLIANRGEIAVRVIRACREMGLGDGRGLLRLRSRRAATCAMADEAVHIGAEPGGARATCASTRIIDAARARRRRRGASRATASSPRTPRSPRACADAGLTFIGPSPEAIALMGSKTAARDARRSRAGVPVVPGTEQPLDARRARRRDRRGRATRRLSADGEGGRRRRRQGHARGRVAPTSCRAPCRPRAPRRGRRSATPRSTSSAGSSRPRHIEIQLLGDQHGTVVPFVERECSIQRRHQKVVEESPSLAVTPAAARARWPRPPPRSPAPSATPTPARSSSCSTRTARSTSSR